MACICGMLYLFHCECGLSFQTGTLTEDGLDMWGVVPIQDGAFQLTSHNPTELDSNSHFVVAMATCHSLTIIENKLTGDPQDLNMFNSINWVRRLY